MGNYKIFCFGGAGGNICSAFLINNVSAKHLYFFNTDKSSIDINSIKNKYIIGLNTTKGMGAGSIPQIAKSAFDENLETFNNLTDDDCIYFVIAGLGGGTGTGMSVKMSELLKKKKKKFIVIVTLPFSFEGRKRRLQALEGLNEITYVTNEAIPLENDNLRKLFGNMTLSEAFLRSDNYVVEVFKETLLECDNRRIVNETLISHYSGLEEIILKLKGFINSNNNLIATVSSKIILADTNKELLKALTINSELIYAISPRKFEEIIEYIYRLSGFETELTQGTRDDGADVLVWTPPPILGNRFLTVVQAKRYNKLNKVGSQEIRDLIGTKMVFNADKAQIITTSDFTKPAIITAKISNIDLLRFYELNEKINQLIN